MSVTRWFQKDKTPDADAVSLPDLAAIERELCERSLREFVEATWPVIEPTTQFIPGWHIDAICDHLEAVTAGHIRDLLITVPPRHMKSSLVSVMWPAWVWGPLHQPGTRWLFSSYAGGLSIRDSVKCRRVIQSLWYQHRWGDRFQLTGDQNAKERYDNNHQGCRIATSVGGTGTGEGGDCICVSPGTVILTIHGGVAVEAVELGEQVLTFNHASGVCEYRPVVAHRKAPGRPMVEVELEDGRTLSCTEDHPVFVEGRGYVAAGSLMELDTVLVED